MRRKTTKEILGESFRELARQKPINKITIANITKNCGMTQPTFYRYFRDKYDIMTWLYAIDAQEIMSRVGREGFQWRNTLLDGMRYFSEHKSELFNAFTHTGGQDAFITYMMKANADLLSAEVRKKLMTENIPEDILLMIKIYCYGTVTYVCEWIVEDMPVSPEKAAEVGGGVSSQGNGGTCDGGVGLRTLRESGGGNLSRRVLREMRCDCDDGKADCRKPRRQQQAGNSALTMGEGENGDENHNMDNKDVILEAMRKAGEPLNAGKVAELTGLERKAVDKAFAAMKKEGSIVSPIRCK